MGDDAVNLGTIDSQDEDNVTPYAVQNPFKNREKEIVKADIICVQSPAVAQQTWGRWCSVSLSRKRGEQKSAYILAFGWNRIVSVSFIDLI